MHHGAVPSEIAGGLLALKKRIAVARIPASKLDESINVALWNIREFGKRPRTDAAIHYIAEILGQFDLVALVELRDNLEDLGRVLRLLGTSWNVIYSDWMIDSGGNRERTAFLFDRRAVTFCGLAAEVDAPRRKKGREYLTTQSFWRAPYMCAFRSGNFDFIAIAAHARWGSSNEGRAAELRLLAEWIDVHFKSKYAEDNDLVVMGDFNIPSLDDDLYRSLTSTGLRMPDALRELRNGVHMVGGSNLKHDARYDQILHLPTAKKRFSDRGGVVDFYGDASGIAELFPKHRYTAEEFTYQLSDHLPVWIQVNVNIDGDRLNQIVQNRAS